MERPRVPQQSLGWSPVKIQASLGRQVESSGAPQLKEGSEPITASGVAKAERTRVSNGIVELAALEAVEEDGDELAGDVSDGNVATHAARS
jgi:hypothetical protein